MTANRLFLLLLGLCLLASACAPTAQAPTSTPTRAARPTRTATSIPTLRPTFTPAPPMVTIVATTVCRAGPGDEYDLVTIIEINPEDESDGYQTVLLGTSGSFWLITAPDGQECWVASQYPLTGSSAADLPTLTPMPTPTLLTPTAAPPAVENILVKKKRCAWATSETPYTHRIVNIIFVIEWADVLGEEGYRVYRDGNLVGELSANVTVFSETFELKKPGRASVFYIVSFNVLGETRSAQFTFDNPC